MIAVVAGLGATAFGQGDLLYVELPGSATTTLSQIDDPLQSPNWTFTAGGAGIPGTHVQIKFGNSSAKLNIDVNATAQRLEMQNIDHDNNNQVQDGGGVLTLDEFYVTDANGGTTKDFKQFKARVTGGASGLIVVNDGGKDLYLAGINNLSTGLTVTDYSGNNRDDVFIELDNGGSLGGAFVLDYGSSTGHVVSLDGLVGSGDGSTFQTLTSMTVTANHYGDLLLDRWSGSGFYGLSTPTLTIDQTYLNIKSEDADGAMDVTNLVLNQDGTTFKMYNQKSHLLAGTITAGANAYTIDMAPAGSTLRVTGSSTNTGAATLNVGGTTTLSAADALTDGAVTFSGDTLDLTAAGAAGGTSLTVNGGTVNADASQDAALVTMNGGVLNANTVQAVGGVDLVGGTMNVNVDNVLSTVGAVINIGKGGLLNLGAVAQTAPVYSVAVGADGAIGGNIGGFSVVGTLTGGPAEMTIADGAVAAGSISDATLAAAGKVDNSVWGAVSNGTDVISIDTSAVGNKRKGIAMGAFTVGTVTGTLENLAAAADLDIRVIGDVVVNAPTINSGTGVANYTFDSKVTVDGAVTGTATTHNYIGAVDGSQQNSTLLVLNTAGAIAPDQVYNVTDGKVSMANAGVVADGDPVGPPITADGVLNIGSGATLTNGSGTPTSGVININAGGIYRVTNAGDDFTGVNLNAGSAVMIATEITDWTNASLASHVILAEDDQRGTLNLTGSLLTNTATSDATIDEDNGEANALVVDAASTGTIAILGGKKITFADDVDVTVPADAVLQFGSATPITVPTSTSDMTRVAADATGSFNFDKDTNIDMSGWNVLGTVRIQSGRVVNHEWGNEVASLIRNDTFAGLVEIVDGQFYTQHPAQDPAPGIDPLFVEIDQEIRVTGMASITTRDKGGSGADDYRWTNITLADGAALSMDENGTVVKVDLALEAGATAYIVDDNTRSGDPVDFGNISGGAGTTLNIAGLLGTTGYNEKYGAKVYGTIESGTTVQINSAVDIADGSNTSARSSKLLLMDGSTSTGVNFVLNAVPGIGRATLAFGYGGNIALAGISGTGALQFSKSVDTTVTTLLDNPGKVFVNAGNADANVRLVMSSYVDTAADEIWPFRISGTDQTKGMWFTSPTTVNARIWAEDGMTNTSRVRPIGTDGSTLSITGIIDPRHDNNNGHNIGLGALNGGVVTVEATATIRNPLNTGTGASKGCVTAMGDGTGTVILDAGFSADPDGSMTPQTIVGVTTGVATSSVTIAGDQTALYADGGKFAVSGSTANDGAYNIVTATFDGTNTVLTVSQEITDPTIDGSTAFATGDEFTQMQIGSATMETRSSSSLPIGRHRSGNGTLDSGSVALGRVPQSAAGAVWNVTTSNQVFDSGYVLVASSSTIKTDTNLTIEGDTVLYGGAVLTSSSTGTLLLDGQVEGAAEDTGLMVTNTQTTLTASMQDAVDPDPLVIGEPGELPQINNRVGRFEVAAGSTLQLDGVLRLQHVGYSAGPPAAKVYNDSVVKAGGVLTGAGSVDIAKSGIQIEGMTYAGMVGLVGTKVWSSATDFIPMVSGQTTIGVGNVLDDFTSLPVVGTDMAARYTVLGDTNLDGDFDIFDVLRINNAGKFLQPAIFAEGDMDLNGTFDIFDVLAINNAGTFLTVAAAMPIDPAPVVLDYDPGTGNLTVVTGGQPLANFWLSSAAGLFQPGGASTALGFWQTTSPAQLIASALTGVLGDGMVMSGALPAGLELGDLAADLTVTNAAGVPAGSISIIPEPATLGLLAMGGLMIIRRRRK